MIMLGGLLVALGVAGLVGLSIWPTLLIGLGAGMILSGVTGKWWPKSKERARGRPRRRERRHGESEESSTATSESL